MIPTFSHIKEAAAFISDRAGDFQPDTGLILGSGLGILGDEVNARTIIPYTEIPHFPRSTVRGHDGHLILGELEGMAVAVMKGRTHFYEGHPIQLLALPVRVMHMLGIGQLIITNAAGGINPAFEAGDLMLISDHINFLFNNPLMGPNIEELGDRFTDTSHAYDEGLKALARKVATECKVHLQEGVYLCNTGPSYETPAEVEMARFLGADAIGMSTVPEAIAAVHCGMKVMGISYISNLAAGISGEALSHAEVIETMQRIKGTFIRLIRGILNEMAQ